MKTLIGKIPGLRGLIWARVAACLMFATALTLVTGCQHPGPQFNPYQPPHGEASEFQSVNLEEHLEPALFHSDSSFTLGPGDRIEVEVMDDPNSKTDLTVGPDGKIYYTLLPGIDVWGMTLPQVSESLQTGLSRFLREPPRVSVSLRAVESRRFWVLGRVQAPGIYVMTNATTLLEAVSLAGGLATITTVRDVGSPGSLDDMADLHHSFIVRHGKPLPVDFYALLIHGDLSQNIYVEPDDFIYFPAAAAREVYVMGAVGQPNTIPYTEGLTMMGAIANCQGTVKEAYLSHIAVVRGSLHEPKVAITDYRAVLRGETPDVLLRPSDIVYVPYEPYRYIVRYVNLIVNTFVSSAAINGGIILVSPNVPTQTGVFIPAGSGVTISR
jgi:protein involved in polysaccharide export with SLBB domain